MESQEIFAHNVAKKSFIKKKTIMSKCSFEGKKLQEEWGQGAGYYTSSQSFIIMFFYSLLNNFGEF